MGYTDKLTVKDFKFGIELEVAVNEDDMEKVTLQDGWRIHDEHCGSEIVSPKLKGFPGLLAVRRQLIEIWKHYDVLPFYDSGLHVHVDIQHFTLGNAKRLFSIATLFDEVIYALMDGSRYNNRYAMHSRYSIPDIRNCITINDLQRLQKHNRYHGLNFMAFQKHGTIEFRYAMATADWPKVYSLIAMYLRIVAFAGSDLPIPADIPSVPRWNSSGFKFAKTKLTALELLKNKFFDMLQIGGDVRVILDKMFDENALDITDKKDEDDIVERKSVVRGLKKQKG